MDMYDTDDTRPVALSHSQKLLAASSCFILLSIFLKPLCEALIYGVSDPGRLEAIRDAGLCMQPHAIMMFAIALLETRPLHPASRAKLDYAFGLFLLGCVVYTGFFYAYAFTGEIVFRHFVPGGIIILTAAWLILLSMLLRISRRKEREFEEHSNDNDLPAVVADKSYDFSRNINLDRLD